MAQQADNSVIEKWFNCFQKMGCRTWPMPCASC
jgi:hypothetical protein